MSLPLAIAVIVGIIAAIGSASLWRKIPTFQCPRCSSYDTEVTAAGLESCNVCGHVWSNTKPEI